MRLTVGCLKGGVAKTTTAVHLALGLCRTGSVLLVDADPAQPSACEWSLLAGEAWPAGCEVRAQAARNLADRLLPVVGRYDHVVIDVGPKNPILLRQALSVSEHLVIPIRPTGQDISEVTPTWQAAIEADQLHPLTAAVLLVDVDTHWPTDERDTRELLAARDIACMDARVRHLRRYGVARGTAPAELGDFEHVLDELIGGEAA